MADARELRDGIPMDEARTRNAHAPCVLQSLPYKVGLGVAQKRQSTLGSDKRAYSNLGRPSGYGVNSVTCAAMFLPRGSGEKMFGGRLNIGCFK